ncbi:MAG TPA: DUF3775 domain-containing protein [Beijerinckiaceae bacterium]|nr:DUF3775 domain-containing protein [Beijerinckiaceae bacterium]
MLESLNPEKVCFVIFKARELHGAMEGVEGVEEDASNPSDDRFASALTTANDEPVRAELRAFIQAMDQDESTELVALCWLGRGDFDTQEWSDAMAAAAERTGPKTPDYLLEMEGLADYLDDGLAAFDLGCEDFEERSL